MILYASRDASHLLPRDVPTTQSRAARHLSLIIRRSEAYTQINSDQGARKPSSIYITVSGVLAAQS